MPSVDSVDSDVFSLSSDERMKVEILNDIAQQIKYDILEKKYRVYSGIGIAPADAYERGVSAAIGLIQHRVHCICDT